MLRPYNEAAIRRRAGIFQCEMPPTPLSICMNIKRKDLHKEHFVFD